MKSKRKNKELEGGRREAAVTPLTVPSVVDIIPINSSFFTEVTFVAQEKFGGQNSKFVYRLQHPDGQFVSKRFCL
jgi:hypothetical protein